MIRNMFSWKRHKRVAFYISLPDTPEFNRHMPVVENCISRLGKMGGVDVYRDIDSHTLSSLSRYDVVIFVAHLDEETNEMVLREGRLPVGELVAMLPEEFGGTIDLSSCYAAQWINMIKERCPQCHVQGAFQQTVLDYRLTIYPHVIRLYKEKKGLEYRAAYEIIEGRMKDMAKKMISGQTAGTLDNLQKKDDDITASRYLGAPSSLIYSPSKVEKGLPFLVQVYIKAAKDSDRSVGIKARRIDPDTGMVYNEELPVNLKKGDEVTVQYATTAQQNNDVLVEESVICRRWMGKTLGFEFVVTVSPKFRHDSFLGKVLIGVNGEPVGRCSFKTKVEKVDMAPAEMFLEVYDPLKERQKDLNELKAGLESNLKSLKKRLAQEDNEENKRVIESSINTCLKCMDLVDKPVEDAEPRRKTVFVSSTCDDYMTPFRETVREVVTELKMNADLCGDWPQSGSNPADICCRKVMESDIYLCILGGRYGYIEPSLDTSMTEMEFHAAISFRKKIFVFVLAPPNETNEPEEVRIRQNRFVNFVKSSRILREFKDIEELRQLSKNDLQTYISSK